jgi:hypothetical protein
MHDGSEPSIEDIAKMLAPPSSKANTVNPKDLFGNKKVSVSKLPAIAIFQGAMAMMDGADKYGAYNWRDKDVIASIYIDAIQRHTLAYQEGEQYAPDSFVHHLGHVIACAAILLDAELTGHLVDDRPKSGIDMGRLMADLSKAIEQRRAALPAPTIER